MSDRQNILAIVRWKHLEHGIQLSWPLLHYSSQWSRAAIVCMLCGLVGISVLAYLLDMPLLKGLEQLMSVSPSWLFLSVLVLPWINLVLDFVLRNRLHIKAQEVVLRRPWGTTRIWPRSALVGAQFEVHVPDPADPVRSKVALVQLILRSDSGRERVRIGGLMHRNVGRQLVDQLSRYTQIKDLTG